MHAALVWILALAEPTAPVTRSVSAQIIAVTATGEGLELRVNAGTKDGVAVGWIVEWAAWKGARFTIEAVTADESRFSTATWIEPNAIMREKRRVRLRPP
jgi:hypothetical protein